MTGTKSETEGNRSKMKARQEKDRRRGKKMSKWYVTKCKYLKKTQTL